jgi:hypothetical protein
MTKNNYDDICKRVDQQHQHVCVRDDGGRIGEVISCQQLTDSFRVKVPPGSTAPVQLWPYNMVDEVTCP